MAWRMALTLLFPTVFTWVYFVSLDGRSTPILWGFYLVGKTFQFSLPLLLSRGFPKRGHRGARRSGRRRAPDFARGAVFGVVIGATALAAAAAGVLPEGLAEAARAKVVGLGIASRGRFLLLCVFYAIAHSFLEEYYWRGFVFDRLRGWLSRRGAVALSSIAFAAHHLVLLGTLLGWSSPVAWGLTAAVAAGGAGWAWLYDRDRALGVPWLSHALVDVGIIGAAYVLVFTG